jgi:hypothetical protein
MTMTLSQATRWLSPEARPALEREQEAFLQAYITAALWSSTNDEGEPLDAWHDADDLTPDALAKVKLDCSKFYLTYRRVIQGEGCPMVERWDGASEGQRKAVKAAHDFWFTRNGYGVGFWDGGWPAEESDKLTHGAHQAGEAEIYVGDDGKLHHW